ncbi:hypothetical protein LEP1GSC171_0825 [Leptospira santarosai str. HAI1380]|uniref:Uncharacterized protein n=1 Tax=Leptospira santarosai str. ZUN179 TaxID=1049985 RepID=M6UKW8_9LEPT|nr:hypothetical protein LEP1GSC187_2609 [Leptospira santarosai str. ZUN179]EMP02917.1 hypothetical protein LEP1GSC171_0825 [Leptospira santarosai str. HAI1380]
MIQMNLKRCSANTKKAEDPGKTSGFHKNGFRNSSSKKDKNLSQNRYRTLQLDLSDKVELGFENAVRWNTTNLSGLHFPWKKFANKSAIRYPYQIFKFRNAMLRFARMSSKSNLIGLL